MERKQMMKKKMKDEDKDKDKDSTVVYTLLLRTHGYHNTKIRS